MKRKISRTACLFVYVCFLLSGPLYAEYVSVGARTGDDYQSNSIRYKHMFNEDYAASLYYSADGLEDNFNSLQLSVDRYFTNSSVSLILGSDYSKDYSRTNTVGLDYSITFKASDNAPSEQATTEDSSLLVSDSITEEVSENESAPASEEIHTQAEQFFIPWASIGARFSKTAYLGQKIEAGSTNLTAGLGTSIGSFFDISGVWNGY